MACRVRHLNPVLGGFCDFNETLLSPDSVRRELMVGIEYLVLYSLTDVRKRIGSYQ